MPGASGTARRWVGVDLGWAALKVVELEEVNGRVRLLRSAIHERAHGSDPASGTGFSRPWLPSDPSNAASVCVAVAGPGIAVRRIHVPLMSREELPEAVKWQVKDQLPFPVQEATVRFHLLGEVLVQNVKQQDLLVAAATPTAIQEALTLVGGSGLGVGSLMPAPVAAWRCVTTLLPEAGRGSVAIVDVGASGTMVSLVTDGTLHLVRDVPIGGTALTESLVGMVGTAAGEVAIDKVAAEALLRRYGTLKDAGEGTTDTGVPLFHLASLIRPVLERLVTELARVFDFYRVQMGQAGVSRVLLCGGMAGLPGLSASLAEGLGIDAEVFNPLAALAALAGDAREETGPSAEGGPRLAVAIGAALDHGHRLNFLAGRDLGASQALARYPWIRIVRGAAVAALALYLLLLGLVFGAHWQVRRLSRAWSAVEPAYHEGVMTSTEIRRMEASARGFQALADEEPVWEGLLKELAAALPNTMQLTSLVVEPDAPTASRPTRFRIKGKTGSGEGDIARFMEALSRSMFCSGVTLVRSERRAGEAETGFEIEGTLE